MIEVEQLEINFGSPVGDGYETWKWDQEKTVRKISEVWGLPLNRRVRLKLVNIDSEFEGLLTLAERPQSLHHRESLILRLRPLKFSSDEIENCIVIDHE